MFLSSCNNKNSYTLKEKFADVPAKGDMIIDSLLGDPVILNPVLASDSSSQDVIGLIFNGLVKYDKDLKLTGDLAEKWTVSPDGRTITFYLRRGVKWHDGAEFTSEDVKFTYDCYIDPNVKTAYRSMFELVGSIETPGKYIVKVNYKKVFAPALETWGVSILPSHILKGTDLNTSPFNRAPVGTGPYRFVKWDTNQKVQLAANDDYFEGRPYISGYVFRIIPDQSVQFMELQAGNLDMMSLTPDLFKTKADSPGFNRNFNKFQYAGSSYVYIGYNLANPLFADKRVRQALAYGINTADMIAGVRRGLAVPLSGPFIPGSWAYNTDVKPYDFKPQKAIELLSAAGWVRGKDGMLYRDGKLFEFALMTNQGNKEREEIALIAQQQLGKLGIKVDIRVLAWNILLTEYINKRKFDAVVMGWQLSKDPDCYDIWHSSKTKEGEFNFVSYKNGEVDALMEKARTTFDSSVRKNSYFRIHKLIADDAPYTFIYSPLSLPAVHRRFIGIKPELAGIGYNFNRWYVPVENQKYKQ
jgi:peptide/nickel transport system substrate-binding protein